MIDARAVVDSRSHIDEGVHIGPFSVIGPEVQVGRGTEIGSHVVIKGPTENGHGFSYGFALMPFATRQKTVPPGTRIFLEGKLFHQPLITFETIDAGTVKNIFQKQN